MFTKRNILLAIFIVTVTSTALIFASDISSLISDLADWNKEKARNASDKLARIGKPAVAHLVVALSSKNTNRKRYGARALREIGQDAADAIPALSKLLGDRDTRTREYAVEALGNMVLQAPQVLPMLEKAKKDRSKNVAEKARLAIEKIKTALTDGKKLAEIVKYRLDLNNVGNKCTSLVFEEESPNQYKGVAEFEDGLKRQVVVKVSGSKVHYSLGDEIKTEVKKADGSLRKPVSQEGEKEGVKIAVASDKQKLKKLEGFRGIKWDTVIADMNDPNFVELWVRTGDTDIDAYGRKDDKLTIGSAVLEYLQYRCYKGKFYSIEIQTPTLEATKHLLAAVSAYYGEPEGELSEVPGSEHLDGRYWRLPIPGSKSPNEYLIMRLWIDEGVKMDLLGNIVPRTIGRFQIKYAPSLIQQVIDDEKEAAAAKNDF